MDVNIIEELSCRVCLNTKCDKTVSFVENETLLTLYQFCADVVVDLNIPPLRVCNKCVEKLDNFAKFKQKCQESEEFWKNTINKSPLQNEDCLRTDNNFYEDYAEIDSGDNTVYDTNCENDLESDDSTKEIENNSIKKVLKSKRKEHKCTTCNRKFKYSKCFINHKCPPIKSVNDDENKVINQVNDDDLEKKKTDNCSCGLCDLSLNDKTELMDHLNEHYSNNLLKCQICGYDGPDFANMISHRYAHVREHVWCHKCDRRSRSAKILEYHYRSAHLHRPGQCVYCTKVFKTYYSWRKHERLHTAKRLFVCDLCDRRFMYKNQIVKHLIDHSDVKDFVCETCGKRFKRLFSLKSHKKNIHKPTDPVICDHCNRRFKSKEKLNLHLKNLDEYKPYQCPVCSKKYRLECDLKYHMFWHTEERPHVCEICGSKYKGKSHLKVHMRKHTGERPYKCNLCGKEYAAPQQLSRHTKVHTGVVQHKCGSCKKKFQSLQALLEHSMLHRNEGAGLKA